METAEAGMEEVPTVEAARAGTAMLQSLVGGMVGDAEMNAKIRLVYGGIAVLELFEGIGRQIVWPIRKVAIDCRRRVQTVSSVVNYNRTMHSAESEQCGETAARYTRYC